jgi:hypothetical protein
MRDLILNYFLGEKALLKFAIIILSVLLFWFGVTTIINGFTSYTSGDAAEIISLYINQSDDINALEAKENLNVCGGVTNIFMTFPDGTPIATVFGMSMLSNGMDLYKLQIGELMPDEVGLVLEGGEKKKSIFDSKLKIKCTDKRFGKIRLLKGESTTLEGYFDKLDVSEKAFISCSYDTNILKLQGNRTFKAIDKGETQIGVLFFDGEKTHIEKIDVRIKRDENILEL